ncbi:hypothetical protein CCACVL1_31075 [Corchorus capsularis]|uniref:Uncharacterized protein n=1 Tax=Corchorus capsularis TaxID=210143 RepID=A0A1R3FTY0_COCAP|nr:hypothetical protein CCACVL1_31075 [Corchorus capsularis]
MEPKEANRRIKVSKANSEKGQTKQW